MDFPENVSFMAEILWGDDDTKIQTKTALKLL